ncbi:MAG: phosphatase PAP2 family protein, partial [Acidimicrobiales bacterium]
GLGLGAAALGVVAGGVALGVLFLLVRSRTGFNQMDLAPARWAARHATSTSTAVLRVVTYLGSTVFVVPLVVAVGVVELRRLPNRSLPAFLLLVEGGQLLLVNLIKAAVDRARPDIHPLASFTAPSFPSGHTATAAATYAALALLLGRRRRPAVRVALAAAAAALTALVAATRVLLGVHWMTDVLAGASLGWAWAALCSMAFGGRLLRFGAAAEQGLAAASTSSARPG